MAVVKKHLSSIRLYIDQIDNARPAQLANLARLIRENGYQVAPYDYLLGEHFSVNLKPPSSVNWLQRVRDYEDRCRAEELEVNLIVNSERGGQAFALGIPETIGCREAMLKRLEADRPSLTARQKWARPIEVVRGTKPHGRMEELNRVRSRTRP